MAYPDKPQILTSYTAEEQSIGNGTLPGQELDVDFAALRTATDELIDFVKLFTRSDGQLANGIVTTESLAASVRIGFDPPEVWASGQEYTTRSTAFSGFGFYLCTTAHTSGASFALDLEAGRWQLLANLTPPGGALIAASNLSDLTNVVAARASLGLGAVATDSIVPVSRGGTGGTDAATARTNLGVTPANIGAQPADATLTALAGYNTNGLVVQTAADTFAGRSIVAGAGISVTNGSGVSGNPTVAVSGVTVAELAPAAVVTASETIASNLNDTTLPTSSAVDAHIPAKLNASGSAPIYACRAWVNFNGTGTVAIRSSGNVSSITDNGTGDYTVNFTTAMPDANYAFVASAQNTHNGGFNNSNISRDIGAPQGTTSLRLNCREGATAVDSAQVSVVIFR